MKQTLSPSGGKIELDVLTAAELKEQLRIFADELRSGFARPAVTIRDLHSSKLDASGNSGQPGATNNPNPVSIYRVKPGMTFDLHRLTIQFEGVTFGTTYATGYIYMMRAGRVVDFAALSAGVPVVFSYTSDAPEFSGNQTVDLLVSGGAVSANMLTDLQGTLSSLPADLVRT